MPVCSAPPPGGLATYAESDSAYVETGIWNRFLVCGNQGRRGRVPRYAGPDPRPDPPTVSYSSLLSGGPFNGPPRQVVLAGRRHNGRPSRPFGGKPPNPLRCPNGSGSGVGTPGERRSVPTLRAGTSPLDPIPKSTLLGVWRSAPKKNGSLSAPNLGSRKTMRGHRRCFGNAAPALLTRLNIVPRHGRCRAL